MFAVSILVIAAYRYFNLVADAVFIYALALYIALFEVVLQIIKFTFRETYNYLINFINGNMKLNREISNHKPLTLWQKTQTALFILLLHLAGLIATYFITSTHYA